MRYFWAKMASFVYVTLQLQTVAQAGQLEVSPVTLDLPAGVISTVLTIANRGSERTGIQVRGFTWSQSVREDQLTPTRALLISPPIAELNPGEVQTVRILLREPPRGTEASYRLLVDELPSAGSSSMVRLALRLSLPLFAAANEPTRPELQWALVTAAGRPELQVINHGTKRERVLELGVQAPGSGPLRAQPLTNAWVLPGAERRWALPAHAELRGNQVQLTGRSDSGMINAAIPVLRNP